MACALPRLSIRNSNSNPNSTPQTHTIAIQTQCQAIFFTKNFKFKLKFSSIQNQASASLISNWNFKTIENCLLRFFKYILSLASLIYLLHSIQWYISHYLMCWYFK